MLRVSAGAATVELWQELWQRCRRCRPRRPRRRTQPVVPPPPHALPNQALPLPTSPPPNNLAPRLCKSFSRCLSSAASASRSVSPLSTTNTMASHSPQYSSHKCRTVLWPAERIGLPQCCRADTEPSACVQAREGTLPGLIVRPGRSKKKSGPRGPDLSVSDPDRSGDS